jgi:hypothetical protein
MSGPQQNEPQQKMSHNKNEEVPNDKKKTEVAI